MGHAPVRGRFEEVVAMREITLEEALKVFDEQPSDGVPDSKPITVEDANALLAEKVDEGDGK